MPSLLPGHLPCTSTAPGGFSSQEEGAGAETLLPPGWEDLPGSPALSPGTKETTCPVLSTALLGITPQVLRHKDAALGGLIASSSLCSCGKCQTHLKALLCWSRRDMG